MVASAVGVMATGATALALNLGLLGQSTVTHTALAGSGSPVSTVIEYRDVYDLPPTTTAAAPPATVVSRATPVTTSRPASAATSPPSTVVPVTPATTAPPVTSPPVTVPPTTMSPTTAPAKPVATTTTLPWWAGRRTIPGGRS